MNLIENYSEPTTIGPEKMEITNKKLFDILMQVNDSQTRIEKQLTQIRRYMLEGIESKAGYTEEATMVILGIKDLRTFRKHAKNIQHKGDKFFPRDFPKLLASVDTKRKRPHLSKKNRELLKKQLTNKC